MDPGKFTLLDLDHIVRTDGRIYRVVGNLDSHTHFLGYNVYTPNADGDRLYRGTRYRKNFTEDDHLPADVLDTYELVAINDVTEHHDPIQSARLNNASFQSTPWSDLYTELVQTFGDQSVGIFGSSMFGLHLTPEGTIRKDIDFVIQGAGNVDVLRQQLPKIRENLGFTIITAERQHQQYLRYQRVFRNQNNSIRSIIARRWTGLQLSARVVTTIRLRDPALTTPIELVTTPTKDLTDVVISGRVTDADSSNLFPRKFCVVTDHEQIDVCILWWKFSTPVRDGDAVILCGSLVTITSRSVVRITDFARHWLKIDD